MVKDGLDLGKIEGLMIDDVEHKARFIRTSLCTPTQGK